jgi:hypothetical protein
VRQESFDKAHVFLSYSRPIEALAERLARELESAGISVWIDREGLAPGTPNWEDAIREAVNGAHAVVLLASPDARDSVYLQAELMLAKEQNLTIIPFWAQGDTWVGSAPLEMLKTQYIDARGDKYSTALATLVSSLRSIIRSNTPPHRLVRNLFAESWHVYAPRKWRNAVGILLYPPPWNRPKTERLPLNDDMVVVDPDAYQSLQALLDDIYGHYLSHRFAPLSYGSAWVLVEYERPFNPPRIVVPWNWLTNIGMPTSELVPYWGSRSLEAYDLRRGTAWEVAEPSKANTHGYTLNETAYGIAINNRTLLDEVLHGSGKQPHPAIRAGFLKRVTIDAIVPREYKYLVVSWDGWSGKPFAGTALRETNKMFDRSVQGEWE